ncbi:GNAT family N-acetyltransferase [Adlercreutzia sp. JBNU-10]|uniref:tRNA carboxymethyluridine synthase n=1 Tax=Adlercreutzia faecimuris TaxID=2897341 RepID=A0ABS9WHN7_9ACTN|nr:GNAT family N-acetyltransferase [Adlercreutzia sp. JBNU-10]MCI2242397.1 GNAT family N-acetyltransferase [Adlercreutzia sp. JBNU-10]
MEEVIADILARLRAEAAGEAPALDGRGLARLLDEHNRRAGGPGRRYVKKALLPFYLRVRDEEPDRWRAWDVDAALEERLLALLRMKPRRTASGVATVTVITKPWPCAGRCLYCPNDVRMPKSYLADEPACQRAERAFFDPYLQVHARLRTLAQMGHPTDKVELIVLGGTWSDYPEGYRLWFAAELFRALDDGVGPAADARAAERRARYEELGIPAERDACAAAAAGAQRAVAEGRLSYNQAVRALYGAGAGAPGDADGAPGGATAGACSAVDAPRADAGAGAPSAGELAARWARAAAFQAATWDDVEAAQRANEQAACRCVGLVVETRPELVDAPALADLRRLGCTKAQVGVQSLDPAVLAASGRGDASTVDAVARAFALLRLFGFKVHAHFMANLPGATPAADAGDYRRLVSDPRFLPDEVKLYPCVLTAGTPLAALHAAGEWAPYDEDVLVRLLAADLRATPPWTRVSRMIRDISSHDIVAGNRKTNLRQLVERRIAEEAAGRPGDAAAEGGGASDRPAGAQAGAGGGGVCGRPAGAQAGAAAARGRAAADAPLVREIRSREIAGDEVDEAALRLEVIAYATAASDERFLQWVTPEGRIAGFLRLSLPRPEALAAHPGVPVGPGEAMIRELHVYGRTSPIARVAAGVQHRGLGRRLVEEACVLAAEAGCRAVLVISAVGTRAYYRGLGFRDAGLYQRRDLAAAGEGAPDRPAAAQPQPTVDGCAGDADMRAAGATGGCAGRGAVPSAGAPGGHAVAAPGARGAR